MKLHNRNLVSDSPISLPFDINLNLFSPLSLFFSRSCVVDPRKWVRPTALDTCVNSAEECKIQQQKLCEIITHLNFENKLLATFRSTCTENRFCVISVGKSQQISRTLANYELRRTKKKRRTLPFAENRRIHSGRLKKKD